MVPLTPLFPRQPVPPLEVATVGGGKWRLPDRKPRNFSLIVFYRGLHCPICRGYLGDLDRRVRDFEGQGVEVIAVSSDAEDRARRAREEWGLSQLTIGYGLSLDDARRWGLFLSSGTGTTSSGVDEPPLFPEPGLFLVRPDGNLYCASVQTMPFARPSFGEVLKAVAFVLDRNYPACGEVPAPAEAAE